LLYLFYSSRYYFILFEVDAPITARFKRFKSKYKAHKELPLEKFVELDDLINFNKEQYNLLRSEDHHQHYIKRRFNNAGTEDDF
jgi:hypothetical protein